MNELLGVRPHGQGSGSGPVHAVLFRQTKPQRGLENVFPPKNANMIDVD